MWPVFDDNINNLFKKNTKEKCETCLGTLNRLLTNVLNDPTNIKYRKFRIENRTIKENLLSCNGIDAILYAIGFMKTETEFNLPESADLKIIADWKDTIDNYTYAEIQKDLNQMSISHPVPRRPFNTRITFPRVLNTTNPFLNNIETISDQVQQYEDDDLKSYARQIIPIDELTCKATEKLFQIQEAIESGSSKDKEPCIRDLILVELTKWFNEEFFEWVDKLPCSICNRSEYPTTGVKIENGNRVEIGYCCGRETKFVRYNDIENLLVSRRGRCGEFANCFTFICRCLDYNARYVLAQFDHVWTEVYSESQKRWIHVDPSDNVIDAPLMYQHGWKRSVDYVIAFSKDDLQDVTNRYSNNHKGLEAIRTKCSTADLNAAIIQLRRKRQAHLSRQEIATLSIQLMVELIELAIERDPTENELKGRSSGNMSWKLDRGEVTFENVFVFEATAEDVHTKKFNLRYSCSRDKYERYSKDMNDFESVLTTYKFWQTCHNSSKNIFRKVEKDWKMVYLAREENAEVGEITWKFNFSKHNLKIKSYDLKFEKETYENGQVSMTIEADNGTSDLKDCSDFTIKVMLTGGQGDCAWQHAQIFRQSLNALNDYPFDLRIQFY